MKSIVIRILRIHLSARSHKADQHTHADFSLRYRVQAVIKHQLILIGMQQFVITAPVFPIRFDGIIDANILFCLLCLIPAVSVQGRAAVQIQKPLAFRLQRGTVKFHKRGSQIHLILCFPLGIVGQTAHQIDFGSHSRIVPAVPVILNAAAFLPLLGARIANPVVQFSSQRQFQCTGNAVVLRLYLVKSVLSLYQLRPAGRDGFQVRRLRCGGKKALAIFLYNIILRLPAFSFLYIKRLNQPYLSGRETAHICIVPDKSSPVPVHFRHFPCVNLIAADRHMECISLLGDFPPAAVKAGILLSVPHIIRRIRNCPQRIINRTAVLVYVAVTLPVDFIVAPQQRRVIRIRYCLVFIVAFVGLIQRIC